MLITISLLLGCYHYRLCVTLFSYLYSLASLSLLDNLGHLLVVSSISSLFLVLHCLQINCSLPSLFPNTHPINPLLSSLPLNPSFCHTLVLHLKCRKSHLFLSSLPIYEHLCSPLSIHLPISIIIFLILIHFLIFIYILIFIILVFNILIFIPYLTIILLNIIFTILLNIINFYLNFIQKVYPNINFILELIIINVKIPFIKINKIIISIKSL